MNRSSLYYEPLGPSAETLELLNVTDRIFTATPFFGARRIRHSLSEKGYSVSRKRVRRLMKLLGLEAIYPRPKTSTPAPGHKIYPYLLRGLTINHANQVWSTDISYIPMQHGFLYLMAVIDWYSRYVLSWSLSNTIDAGFCVETLKAALELGTPEIFNTDQGSQFTSDDFVDVLLGKGIQVSMDGRGRWMDNVFVERLWRSLKYEEVYLHAYENTKEARAGIGAWFSFYNMQRPHQALNYKTPMHVYNNSLSASSHNDDSTESILILPSLELSKTSNVLIAPILIPSHPEVAR